MNGLRSTIVTYDFHKPKLPPFLNTPTRPGIIRSGKRLGLLTEILTSTLVVIKAIYRSLHPIIVNKGSGIGIPEAWMPTIRQHSRPLREQFHPLIRPTIILDLNPPTMSEVRDTHITNNQVGTNSPN